MEPMNNFTPRAQQVLALARKEADRFHHNYVGTEHLLLGLINLGQGVAVNVLQKMGLDLQTVRSAVEKQVGTGPESKPSGNIPYTPRVKKVLALAGKEAKALNHSYVGTEHILLGLLREGEGVAARVLKSLEVDIERCRNEILSELDPNFTGEPEEASAGGAASGAPDVKKDTKTPALKAFGRDLTELAKTRKQILEKLLPRLKIANIASISGKFLIVKGTKRTYKIHIGSTNILMEPNDQYLCIVPDRSASKSSEKLFIPFEGDRGFSILLSKAFLLAEDDKITDTTILSQIKL